MMGTMTNTLLSFISEAIIFSSTELILFGIALLGYLMMYSFSLCTFSLQTANEKSAKVCESDVISKAQCTSQEISHRFERSDYQGVVALWPAVMCSGCLPGGAALSQIIESMEKLGMQVQTIAGDIRRALKQNAGLCADVEGLCNVVDSLKFRGCVRLLQALFSVFEELESELGRNVIDATAGALQSLTPAPAGCIPQDEETVAEQALVLQKPPLGPNVEAAQLLGGLTTDLAAEIFSFTELSDVRNCVGLACHGLHNAIWRQPDFWVGLGGPVFADSLNSTERPTSIVPMMGCFRRWVFGLDGDWSLQVEELGSVGHPADALRSVLGYVQVLQSGDATLYDIWRLVRAAESAMQRADVQDNVLLDVASELVATCQKRKDIFGSVDNKDLIAALVVMEKRAEQEKLADERNRWFFSDEAGFDEQGADNVDHSLLSLSFLAVMDQQ